MPQDKIEKIEKKDKKKKKKRSKTRGRYAEGACCHAALLAGEGSMPRDSVAPVAPWRRQKPASARWFCL